VFNVIHPEKLPIAEQPLIKDFFTAKRKSEVKIPSENQISTWDVSHLVQHIKSKYA
jgi:hypothetical protein